MSDTFDDDRRLATPAEGVRILGAQPVGPAPRPPEGTDSTAGSDTDPGADDAAALELTWSASGAHPDDLLPKPEAQRGSRGARNAPDRPPAARDEPPAEEPAPEAAAGDTATSGDEPPADVPAPAEVRSEPPTGEIPPLPHWTEPPTGAVPAIFADDDDGADAEMDAWAAVAGAQPRFRSEGSDWAESDFAEDLSGEHVRLGALAEEAPVDEEAAFARDLAARRRIRGRGAGAATARRAPRRAPRPPRAEAEPAENGPRDVPTAIITAAAVAVVAIVCFMKGQAWTVALAALVVGIATVELASTLQRRGIRLATLVALVASTLMPIATYNKGTAAYPVFFGLVVIVSMLWFLWEITPGRPLAGVAATVLVFAYVGGLGSFAGLLLRSRDGVGLVFGVAVCTIAYDVLGFFVGSQFGRTAIAPNVSPNKTVEGTIAGMLAAVVAGAAVAGQVAPWTPAKGAVLGILVALGAFAGDLCESMFKRDLGVKDFGSLLPGHGGVLDRFDALLFCLPIAYYLALQFKIF